MFVCNFNRNLAASRKLEAGAKYQYLCTIVRGEELRQFDSFSANVEGTETLNVDYIIRVLAQYFPHLNLLSKQKRSMRCGMKIPRSLTVRRYAARLIDLNEYLASFPGATLTDKIGITELNEILLNIMPNSWYKHAYVQGFDSESITFRKAVNMFERMEITESIYEGVVELSYKKPPRAYSNRAGISRQKIGEVASSWTRPDKGEGADKYRKRHVDIPTGKSKTCLIHGPRHCLEKCKFLGDFRTKYTNRRPTNDRGSRAIPREKLTGSRKKTTSLTIQ